MKENMAEETMQTLAAVGSYYHPQGRREEMRNSVES